MDDRATNPDPQPAPDAAPIDVVLVLDAGSSSLKFAAYAIDAAGRRGEPLVRGQVDAIGKGARFSAHDGCGRPIPDGPGTDPGTAGGAPPATHADATARILDWLGAHRDGRHRLVAAGHRVVQGGSLHVAPVQIDARVLDDLQALCELAPLHQPPALHAIRALRERVPALPQVACFDTAFHATQPEVARGYALPRRLRDEGIRVYGFHGLSYQWIAAQLPRLLGARAEGRVVVAHLGNGASLCALRERRSVATTMGFTALDGLMMGTRCGHLDPGVVLHLIERKGLSVAEVSRLLYQESGLLGVSGIASDLRTLAASAEPAAAEAIELFVYRIVREIGSMAAAIGGLDALVFTGGIGEHSVDVRRRVCEGSAWLGIALDRDANGAEADGPRRISQAASPASAWVVPTDEESVIADAVCDVIGR